MGKRLLIRADDLGFSEAVNYGIAKTVKEGIIRSVGLMPGMPAAEHGFDLIKDENICLGQHTNICVGKPLVDPAKIPSITNEKGEFKSSREYRAAKEDFVVLDEVILEIEAQYQRFVEITGREPEYFEGHAVAGANFFKGLAIVAGRHGLDYLELKIGEPISFGTGRLNFYMDSMKPDYDPYESLKNCIEQASDDVVQMFVCHPGYLDDYILTHSSLTIPRTKEVEMCCDAGIKDYLVQNQVEMITYNDLK